MTELKRPSLHKDHRLHLPIFKSSPMRACCCLEKILFYATDEILKRTNMWKTYYHKEDIPGTYTFYICYSCYV